MIFMLFWIITTLSIRAGDWFGLLLSVTGFLIMLILCEELQNENI